VRRQLLIEKSTPASLLLENDRQLVPDCAPADFIPDSFDSLVAGIFSSSSSHLPESAHQREVILDGKEI
jgi:hypothetical protein